MYFQTKGNKYHSTKAEYNGFVYHSKKEAAYAQELDLRVKAKDIRSWERQKRLSLDVNGFHICDYVIDFVIHNNDNSRTYVEVKGFETREWHLKWKLTEALMPTIDPDGDLLLVK
jgi:hypothetical protein